MYQTTFTPKLDFSTIYNGDAVKIDFFHDNSTLKTNIVQNICRGLVVAPNLQYTGYVLTRAIGYFTITT